MHRPAGTIALLALCAAAAAAQESGPCAAARAVAGLDGGADGVPLLVRGQVFAPDGTTPAAGVVVYAYHTAPDGLYHPAASGRPRHSGYIRTGADGGYEYRTIVPGAYPGRRFAAHIHHHMWGGGYPPQYGTDVLFAGDALISERERRESEARGRFGSIHAPMPDAGGTLVIRHDLRLEADGDRVEAGAAAHGLDACR